MAFTQEQSQLISQMYFEIERAADITQPKSRMVSKEEDFYLMNRADLVDFVTRSFKVMLEDWPEEEVKTITSTK